MTFASDSLERKARDVDKAQRKHAKSIVRRYLKQAPDVQRYFPAEFFKLHGVRPDLIPACVAKVEMIYANNE